MANRLRRALFSPWSVLVVAALAVGVGLWVSMDRGGAGDAEAGGWGGDRRVPVAVEPVRAASLAETVRGVGTLRAFETVEIRPEVAGRVRAIGFEEGGGVDEGQVLFELDDEKLQRQLAARRAALRAAAVRVKHAERSFERRQTLYERGVSSSDALDQAREAMESALAEHDRVEAELALVEAQLDDMRIAAPFAGTVSQRHVDRGAYVGVGDTLVTLYQSDPIEISFAVPERYVGRIHRGQAVAVTLAAYPDEAFEGTVRFVSPAVNEPTRTLSVRAVIPNPDGKLKPGAFATAIVTLDVRESRPVIPAESLVATRGGYIVYVVDEDRTAHRREVRTGLRRDGVVEIVDGLEIGESVVRTGHLRLSDGDAVEVTNETEPLSRT